MSVDRVLDVRVERSAVLAVERSLLDMTSFVSAQPSADFGIDLLAFRVEPFSAIPIQVKGARSGITVWRKYSAAPIVMAYVLEPLSESPMVCVMSGAEAWELPNQYIARGGKASDHHPSNDSYRWASVTRLLWQMLAEKVATPERWANLFHDNRAD